MFRPACSLLAALALALPAALGGCASDSHTAAAPVAAASLPAYKSQTPVEGPIRAIGSDTMDHLMVSWGNAFRKTHPKASFECELKGSATAIPALVQGQSDFGPMSRQAKLSEEEAFKSQFGHGPVQVPVAVDTVAVFLHPSNPLAVKGLTLRQVDAIYSLSRNLNATREVNTWGDLGVEGPLASQSIKVYSRNSASGTYAFFREKVLLDGAYKPTNICLPGSEDVVRAVADETSAIGFSGIGYAIPQVVAAKLREPTSTTFVEPSKANAYSGRYPLTRNLYLTFNMDPAKGLTPMQREFLSFVLSQEGQDLVKAQGFYPLSAETVAEYRTKLKL